MKLKTWLTFLFFFSYLALATTWIGGSAYDYYFPLCKTLNVKISAVNPISENEIEVYPNCTLIQNDTFNLEYDCDCHNGYTLYIKPHAFANNTYDILISFTYEQTTPTKIVEKRFTQSAIIKKPIVNETIINQTIIQPTKIEEKIVYEVNKTVLEQLENLTRAYERLQEEYQHLKKVHEREVAVWVLACIILAGFTSFILIRKGY